MTDILCKWLNDDVHVSRRIDAENFASEFSSGYLIGEVLCKFALQEDFSCFSQTSTADSKLNNFTRIEPTMALLGVPFDTNVAKEIIKEKPGIATRLLYQLFIELGKKTKMKLTGIAMETMRASAPAKLASIESDIYKERLKTIVPRQVDLNFENLVEKYNARQKEQQEKSIQARMEEEDKIRKYQQHMRDQGLQRSKQIRDKQGETMARIREATVKIPKPPPSRKDGRNKAELLKEKITEDAKNDIEAFQKRLKTALPPMSPLDVDKSNVDIDVDIFVNADTLKLPTITSLVKPALNDDYVQKIRTRLNEDAHARKEREKRRRRVLIEQLKSHEAQEEAHREEMLVNRLMRQSQMERRIAVQLMHVRHEKGVLKRNRMAREHQFMERRLKDFSDALEREAESCRQARLQYDDEIKKNKELHDSIAEERAKSKYLKHYNICKQVLLEIVDFSCKVGEYRELTERLLPPKLVREWKALFVEGQPLYSALPTEELDEAKEEDLRVEEEKIKLLDEEDFKEYKEFIGEWKTAEDCEFKGPPVDNAVLGHIMQRLFNIVYPPEVPPPPPEFPPFPIKACVLGKFFCGKTTAAQQIAATHRVTILNIDDLTEEAVEAYKNKETLPDAGGTVEQGADVESPNPDAKKEEESRERTPTDQPLPVNPVTDVEAELSKKKEVEEQPVEKVETPDDTKPIETAKSDETPYSPISKTAPPSPMLTNRAKLGGKAFSFLKKGKCIPDSLLVDITVDAVRSVPNGTGWIMDNFPATLNQAKLLEKSLTGVDPSLNPTKSMKDAKKQIRKSRIAPDPHPPPEGQPYKSGFDLVVWFDIDDETVLRRAEGRTYNPENAEEYHQEFNPPPDGSYTGVQTQAKVETVFDPSNEREQVQTRLTSFQDSWPKLDKWYTKYSTLHKIDVNKTREEVYEELAAVLEETVQKLHGPVEEDKQKEAEKIAAEEEEKKKAEDAQRLEVESQKPPEVPTTPVSETKIQKPLKPGSSKTKKGGKRDGRSSPGTPKKGGKDAKEKQRKGSPKASSPSPKKKGEKNSSPKKGSRSPSPSKPGSRSGSRGSKGRKSPVRDEPEEPPPEPEGPPEPEPGSAQWEYVNLAIDIELAESLVSQWQNLETTYIDSSKHVFRQLRDERENIYRYFYETRNDFVQLLMRPDTKQEFVEQWQRDYNEVAEDTRDDEETKQELNQRVEDLCERLWDICDTRKEESESERANIMKEGWQEDHIGLLTNHYVSLMQGELDRYQESCKLLKDYYVGMEGGPGPNKAKMLPETDLSNSRLPLVDLPPTLPPGSVIESPPQEVKILSAKTSREKEKEPKTPEGEEDEENKRRIPLVPRRPKSADPQTAGREKRDKKTTTPKKERAQVSDEKLDSPIPPADPDERLLFDAYLVALQVIEGQNAAILAEEETEALRQADLEREKEREVQKNLITVKKSKKGGRKSGDKSRSPARTHPAPDTPPAATDEASDAQNEEEKQKKILLQKAHKEYKGSILSEGNGLRMRLELIKAQSTSVIQDLKAKAQQTYKDMNDWLGERFLQEMDSIDCLAKAAREAIEREEKLQTGFVLEDKDLIVDLDLLTFKIPMSPPPPSPKEQALSDTFTVVQLMELYKQFLELAPSGLIAVKAFCETFLDLASCTTGMEPLPENWMAITFHQLQEICNLLSADREYIDWRSFLVCAAKPWTPASNQDLLDALESFKDLDQLEIGKIKREEYENVQLWFQQSNDPPADADDPPTYNRTEELHKALFDIFADIDEGFETIDYTNMLLYFCVTQHPLEGFLRALSMVTGKPMPSKDDLDFKLQEFEEHLPILKDQISPPELLTDITLDHLLEVFNHGKRFVGDDNRFSTTPDPVNLFSKERLAAIYAELSADEDESIPLYLLYQHPVMRDCIHMCERYRFVDIKSLVKPLEISTADQPGT